MPQATDDRPSEDSDPISSASNHPSNRDSRELEDASPLGELVEKYVEENRQGNFVSIESFLKRYPEHSGELRKVLQTIELLEDFKSPDSTLNSLPMDGSLERVLSRDGRSTMPRSTPKFEFLDRIGVGGFGTVWKARDLQLGRMVAVKILHERLLTDEMHQERFLREARSAGQLRHPNIVTVYEVTQLDGVPAIVSAFVAGPTLFQLRKHRGLTYREMAIIAYQIACALDYAHSMGLVHRDVKPANILIDFDSTGGSDSQLDRSLETSWDSQRGSPSHSRFSSATSSELTGSSKGPRAMLLDFGLALREEVEQTMTMDGQVLGTPTYMCPEQAMGRGHNADGRCDVYSVGVILYEMLTGQIPFQGSKASVIHQVIHDDPQTPRSIISSIPKDLETICLKAMSKRPDDRYATAGDMAMDLGRWLDHEPIQARPPTSIEQLRRLSRRYPALAGSLFSVFAMLIVFANLAAIFAFRYSRLATSAEAARKSEASSRMEETKARERESIARQASDRSLVDMYTAFGIQSDAMSRPTQSAPWYFAALAAEQSSVANTRKTLNIEELNNQPSDRLFEHYLRLQNASYGGAIPVRAKSIDSGVNRLRWSPIGRYLLTLTSYRLDAIWDLQEDREVVLRDAQGDILSKPWAAACWSPDGQWLYLADEKANLHRYEVKTWKLDRSVSTVRPLTRLNISQDGQWLSTFQGSLGLWRADRLEKLDEVPVSSPAFSLTMSHSGDWIVMACEDSNALIFRKDADGKLEHRYTRTHAHVTRPVETPPYLVQDERRLLTLTKEDGLAYWDLETGDPISTEPNRTFACVYCPKKDVGITFWSFKARLFRRILSYSIGDEIAHRNSPYDCQFSLDGNMVVTGAGDRMMGVWSTIDGRPIVPMIEHQADVRAVAISPDNRLVASATFDGICRVWELRRGFETLPVGKDSFVSSDPKGQWAADGMFQGSRNSKSIQVRNRNGQVAGPHLNFEHILNSTSFHPTEPAILALLSDASDLTDIAGGHPVLDRMVQTPGSIELWNWKSGEPIFKKPVSPEPLNAAWRPDGKEIAVFHVNGKISFVDPTSGELLAEAEHGANATPLFVVRKYLCYTPNQRYLIAWSRTSISIWDPTTHQLIDRIDLRDPRKSNLIHMISCDPSSQRMAVACGDGLLRIYDLESRRMIQSISHPDWIFHCLFSSDGTRIATACRDQMARVWDLDRGELAIPALHHDDEVFGLAFSADDRWLVTCGRDSTVRIWDASSGKRIVPTLRLPNWLYDVHITQDQNYALVSGLDPGLFVIPLKDMLQVTDWGEDLDRLRILSEVISGQRFEKNGVVNMTGEEWMARWKEIPADHRIRQVEFLAPR